MGLNVAKEMAVLQRSTAKQLQERYAEIFGEASRTGNKAWLVKRIAWRLQAMAEGDLSERARRRAEELANDADLRLSPPKTAEPSAASQTTASLDTAGSSRLPPSGSVLTRRYKRRDLQVRVLDAGFEFEGEVYRSLSALAKKITGSHCNGFHFFGLGGKS